MGALDSLLGLGSEDDDPRSTDAGVGSEPSETTLSWLDPAVIRPNRFQPREHFDEEELDQLAASVAELGVLQPLLVRRIDAHQYELVAGERRWRAAQRANLDQVPAIVRDTDDRSALEQAVVENLHRRDLSAVEEGAAYRQLMEDFGFTQEAVAARVGKSRSAVANTLRLLQLAPEVQKLITLGALSAGHARALLALGSAADQRSVAARVVSESLSVRETEDLVRRRDQSAGDGRSDRGGGRDRVGPSAAREIEVLLSERLATSVRVSTSGGRGRLVIDFADLADLDRIYRELTTSE